MVKIKTAVNERKVKANKTKTIDELQKLDMLDPSQLKRGWDTDDIKF